MDEILSVQFVMALEVFLSEYRLVPSFVVDFVKGMELETKMVETLYVLFVMGLAGYFGKCLPLYVPNVMEREVATEMGVNPFAMFAAEVV